jgi:hypothetical protein
MKRLWAVGTILPLVAMAAAAQDDTVRIRLKADLEKMVAESKMLALDGGAMGSTVKGAPYAGVEVTESTQVLADGTRIHNEQQTKVFRDSEGRVRRETPEQVTIWDPVSNASYFLDPKTQAARKTTMRTFFYNTVRTTAGATGQQTVEMRVVRDGVTTATVNGQPVDPAELKRLEEEKGAMAAGGAVGAGPGTMIHAIPAIPGEGIRYSVAKKLPPAQSEALGNRVIEGVNCEGSRSVSKIETGAIGNDRPIEITSEKWYSPDLQTVVMTRRNDPRTGEEIFRLTNVARGEQPADLFQVPANYQLQERK